MPWTGGESASGDCLTLDADLKGMRMAGGSCGQISDCLLMMS